MSETGEYPVQLTRQDLNVRETPATPAKEVASNRPEESSVEHVIQKAERELGLDTEYARLSEACLFVDKKFFDYELITSDTPRPERIFGDNAWADYLSGRLFAKRFGKNELTPEFIVNLHTELAKRKSPDSAGKIRDYGVVGGAEDGMVSLVYSKEEIEKIENNPYLSFRKISEVDPEHSKGLIVYPHGRDESDISGAIMQDMQKICDWFNTASNSEDTNPYAKAGSLQQRLASLHPFTDVNGTLSRVLMNWSLENDGLEPAQLDEPDKDLLSSEEEWTMHVTEGSKKHSLLKQWGRDLREAGIDKNPSALFGLGEKKAFYSYVFKNLKPAPVLSKDGNFNKPQIIDGYMEEFQKDMNEFNVLMTREYGIKKEGEDEKRAVQGGLITSEYMDFIVNSHPTNIPEAIRERFFTSAEVYRGLTFKHQITDEMLCNLFLNFSTAGGGNRVLNTTSLTAIDPQRIRASMEYYNRIMANGYLLNKLPRENNPYGDNDLNIYRITRDHVDDFINKWDSPFASTSFNYNVSQQWAWKHKGGILLRANLPREGIVMTFGQSIKAIGGVGIGEEKEAMIAGGVPPVSTNEVELFELSEGMLRTSRRALHHIENGIESVIIEDRKGEFVVKRLYTYDTESAKFVLSGEEQTQIRSDIPIDAPVQTEIVESTSSTGSTGDLDTQPAAKPAGDGSHKKTPISSDEYTEFLKDQISAGALDLPQIGKKYPTDEFSSEVKSLPILPTEASTKYNKKINIIDTPPKFDFLNYVDKKGKGLGSIQSLIDKIKEYKNKNK